MYCSASICPIELFQYDRLVHCELNTWCLQSGEHNLKNHFYKARRALGLSKKIWNWNCTRGRSLNLLRWITLPRQPVIHWKWQVFLIKTNHLQNQDYFVTTRSLSCSRPGVWGTQVGATPTDAWVTAKTEIMDAIFAAGPDCKRLLTIYLLVVNHTICCPWPSNKLVTPPLP